MRYQSIGESGQRLIAKSNVTIIGCGALGSVSAELLARAGIGKIHLADRDFVELSNLHRQQLFTEQDASLALPKVVAAKKRLHTIRSDIHIHTYFQHVDAELMEKLTKKSDLIIDATDNFETRLLINDAAYKYGIPWIYGACIGSSGVVFPFVPHQTPCFRCLLPALPSLNDTCDATGVIAPAVQVTAARQVAEAIKWITGNRKSLATNVHHFDLWTNQYLNIGVKHIKHKTCESCGDQATYPSLSSFRRDNISYLCGGETIQILPEYNRNLTLVDAEKAAKKITANIKRAPYFVEFLVKGHRVIVFHDGRILIHGLADINQARKLYVDIFG